MKEKVKNRFMIFLKISMENGFCMIQNLRKYLFSLVIAAILFIIGGLIILKLFIIKKN